MLIDSQVTRSIVLWATCCFGLFLMLTFYGGRVFAQQAPSENKDREINPDSLMSYDLAEIVVSDGSIFKPEANTVQKLTIAEINRENETSVSYLARLIPAAHVQTNSRGESLIYLRNAGERQVALFFNGALLNVPWDNRMNLDLVPANIIGGVTVTKGVPSTLYGTNVLGGAINITSRTLDHEGSVTEIGGVIGQHATSDVAFAHIVSTGGYKFTAAGGYNTRDGLALPPVNLFSQNSSSVRSNTDRKVLNLFGQGSYRWQNGTEVGLSYLYFDGDFGIAPEGHLNPAESSVRYWRYPHFANTTVILNASAPLGTRAILRGAAWGSWFEQHINSYTSDQYDNLEEQQQDEDVTFGSRITYNLQIGEGQLSIALNGLQSEHREVTLEAGEDGDILQNGTAELAIYEQVVFSAGSEYMLPLSENLRLNIGGSLDGISTPQTGDKPARPVQTGVGVASGLQYRISDHMMLRASSGRKVRFPTMRELFGVALNRFLLNPDLKPETSFVTEMGIVLQSPHASGEIIWFYQRTHDTIDQQNVNVDGQSLRQRINLDGSRVHGVELVGRSRVIPSLLVDGHLTMMQPRGIDDGETIQLTEKPAVLGSLGLTHNHASGIAINGQATYTGRAYGRDEANELVPLVRSVVIDAKLSYLFTAGNQGLFTEVFLRVDNVFDAETLPQLGLPGAGRLFRAGLNVSF